MMTKNEKRCVVMEELIRLAKEYPNEASNIKKRIDKSIQIECDVVASGYLLSETDDYHTFFTIDDNDFYDELNSYLEEHIKKYGNSKITIMIRKGKK